MESLHLFKASNWCFWSRGNPVISCQEKSELLEAVHESNPQLPGSVEWSCPFVFGAFGHRILELLWEGNHKKKKRLKHLKYLQSWWLSHSAFEGDRYSGITKLTIEDEGEVFAFNPRFHATFSGFLVILCGSHPIPVEPHLNSALRCRTWPAAHFKQMDAWMHYKNIPF